MKPIVERAGLLLVVTLLTACTGETPRWSSLELEIKQTFPNVEHISLAEYSSQFQGAVIIDVREADEYAVSHLPGAIHVQNLDVLADIADNNEQPLVLYCSVGYRSASLVQQLQDLGLDNVYNLQGALFAWANNGKPLVNENGSTANVHPYDSYWGKLLNADVQTSYKLER